MDEMRSNKNTINFTWQKRKIILFHFTEKKINTIIERCTRHRWNRRQCAFLLFTSHKTAEERKQLHCSGGAPLKLIFKRTLFPLSLLLRSPLFFSFYYFVLYVVFLWACFVGRTEMEQYWYLLIHISNRYAK